MKPETVLTFFCVACGKADNHVTSDHEAAMIEAAFRDGDTVLSLQVIDAEGQIRTVNLKSEYVRKIQRTPLTQIERADMERKIRGDKPLPRLTMNGGKR